MYKDYKKDIFGSFAYEFEHSHIKIIREADTFSTYSLFTFTYYLIVKFREKSEELIVKK